MLTEPLSIGSHFLELRESGLPQGVILRHKTLVIHERGVCQEVFPPLQLFPNLMHFPLVLVPVPELLLYISIADEFIL